MTLNPGTRLGPYEVASELGSGGMGEVYLSKDTRLDRSVAVKILPEHLALDPQRRERFEREARAISSLNHPHICTLHDVGEQDGIHFLVMEHVEGETLADRLEKGRLPLDKALEYAIQMADALDKAHRHGVVHRDLKPGNIMLTKSGVKLLDFGLAKLTGDVPDASPLSQVQTEDPSQPLTAEGSILGTLQYMAPEQLEGKEADARSDIFAFGSVVYEMVTGTRPFAGASQASLIASIMEHDPQAMFETEALTPELLDHVVKICMAKDPDERWQSASDAMLELKWVVKIGSTGPRASETSIAARTSARERIAWAGLAVVALIAAVSLLFDLGPGPSAPETRLEITALPTSDPFSVAISSDGRKVVFGATFEGQSQLWLRSLESSESEPLPGTAGALFPFWSPDDRSVGFFADQQLKRIDLDGGLVRELANAPAGNGGTWNSDGVILYAPTVSGPLFRIAATGGNPTAVTRVEAQQTGHLYPHFLPDGRYFLYVGNGENRRVYVADLDGTLNQRLLDVDGGPAVHALGQLLFTRQGSLFAQKFDSARLELTGDPFPVADQLFGTVTVALSASAAGPIVYRMGAELPREFLWLDRSGSEMGSVGDPDLASPEDASMAPDGSRLLVRRTVDSGLDVWLLDVASGLLERLTSDPLTVAAPIWSPDGTRAVFGSNRDGAFNLYEKTVSGVMSERLLFASEGENKLPSDWSRDGRHILYRALTPERGYDVWALPLDENGDPSGDSFPVALTEFDERDGQFSPDGNWVAYQSNQSGRFEIYVRPFPGPGTERQISTDGGAQVRWRSDGAELFYLTLDGMLMSVPVQIIDGGQAIDRGAPLPLFQTSIGGAVQGYRRQQYIVAPDGGSFLMTTFPAAYELPITVLLNWNPGS